ncbi:hypothetical protein BH11PLA1_BH11PLA1_04690 [soil metagenome]
MLVITRREGEEIVIGDPRNPIGVVRIASIRGDRVRVALDFPRTVEVHRREIADQITGVAPAPATAAAEGALAGAAEVAGSDLPPRVTPPTRPAASRVVPPMLPVVTRPDVIGSIKPRMSAGG